MSASYIFYLVCHLQADSGEAQPGLEAATSESERAETTATRPAS